MHHHMHLETIIEVAGAIAILLAFILAQVRVLDTASLPYLVLNLAGSAVLAVVALIGGRWGFLLLEGAWALVSAWGLVRLARGRAPDTAH
jgi:hypothetical protein